MIRHAIISVAAALYEDHCTTIIGSKGSTEDGSVFATHSNDCSDCDNRIAIVPARDYKDGAMRPVYEIASNGFPRLVKPDRARIYDSRSSDNAPHFIPMGHIPEVKHTFALYESSYSLMNEKGLGIGESTCASVLDGRPKSEGGKALFCAGSLIQVALERCETAVCAAKTMGEMGVKYGFYGEESETGEALTLVDSTGDAWMWHMTAAYNGTSAVWAAQRIPHGHVSASSNTFVIREVPVKHTEDFLFSDNIREAARHHDLWKEGPLDFASVFGYDPPWTTAKTISPLYASLRRWRIFDRVAPSHKFIPYAASAKLPFSVKVEKPLSMQDVMSLHQDFYEDTPFDLTTGVLAGPFGLPYRQECVGDWCQYFNGKESLPQAQIARGISIQRTSYVQISQSGIAHPKVWYGPDMPTTSVFVPLYASNIVDESIAKPYQVGNQKTFVYGESAWWAHDLVANWMTINFRNMSERYVYPLRNRLQNEVFARAAAAEKSAAPGRHAGLNKGILQAQVGIQKDVATAWWGLASTLIVRYNDGFLNYEKDATVDRLGMSGEFLSKVGSGCNSVFASWPYPEDNVFPYALEDLQSPLDLAARPRDSPQWYQCAPDTKDTADAMPKMAESFAATELTSTGEWGFPYLSVGLCLAGLCVGIIIGRVSKGSDGKSGSHYDAMP